MCLAQINGHHWKRDKKKHIFLTTFVHLVFIHFSYKSRYNQNSYWNCDRFA